MIRRPLKDTPIPTSKKIDVSDLYPKRKTISEKYKEDIELEKLTRLLK